MIHISEIKNETKDDALSTKGVKVFLDDFKNIFFEELNELPPTREVDHAIDLIANAALVAKAPYHHSLAQNVELKNQLKDLLNKRYIRPSRSLWRALVLLLRRKIDLSVCV